MKNLKSKFLLGLLLAFTSMNPLFAVDYMNAESFAEANGISHQWFPIQKMLIMRKGLNSIKLRVGETTAIANEKEIKLSNAPRVQNNSIYVPADILKKVFVGSKSVPLVKMVPVQKPPTTDKTNSTNQSTQIFANQNLHTSSPTNQPPNSSDNTSVNNQTQNNTQQMVVPNSPKNIEVPQNSEAILIALRHSVREDHTRVVLEFNNTVTYKGDFKNGIYRLVVTGCKNLIPTSRSNPVGRDIAKLDINSGANREGLILTFTLNQSDKSPVIKYLTDPFRMIVEIPSNASLLDNAASSTPSIIPPKIIAENIPENKNDIVKPVEIETPPEINIEVPMETLRNSNFKGRTIVIDPGHGGEDNGFVVAGRPPEKTINLETSILLKQELEKAGFRAVLLRTNDKTLSYVERLSLANKNGGDLHLSIHTGGSVDPLKHGVACYIYSSNGIYHNENSQGTTYDAVYTEWLKTTRFDLSAHFAKKINERMIKHLQTDSRGVNKSPVLPLKFIMSPAVLVEIGMLSDKVEGKNLISEKYKQAIAKSITNAVIDFFNSIKLN